MSETELIKAEIKKLQTDMEKTRVKINNIYQMNNNGNNEIILYMSREFDKLNNKYMNLQQELLDIEYQDKLEG